MLDSIKAKTIDSRGFNIPLSPIIEFFLHVGIINIKITTHQKVEITFFLIYTIIKFLPLEKIDCILFFIQSIVVYRAKVPPVPFKF